MKIGKELEDLVFDHIDKNKEQLDASYQQLFPERLSGEYYDSEHYEIWVFEEAYSKVLEEVDINSFIN